MTKEWTRYGVSTNIVPAPFIAALLKNGRGEVYVRTAVDISQGGHYWEWTPTKIELGNVAKRSSDLLSPRITFALAFAPHIPRLYTLRMASDGKLIIVFYDLWKYDSPNRLRLDKLPDEDEFFVGESTMLTTFPTGWIETTALAMRSVEMLGLLGGNLSLLPLRGVALRGAAGYGDTDAEAPAAILVTHPRFRGSESYFGIYGIGADRKARCIYESRGEFGNIRAARVSDGGNWVGLLLENGELILIPVGTGAVSPLPVVISTTDESFAPETPAPYIHVAYDYDRSYEEDREGRVVDFRIYEIGKHIVIFCVNCASSVNDLCSWIVEFPS